MKVRKYRVYGRVQGVGFRFFTRHTADSLGITGYAANLSDGSVEVLARGTDAALDALEAALRDGPRYAEVLEVRRLLVDGEEGRFHVFSIR